MRWAIPAISAIIALVVVGLGIHQETGGGLAYTWRWFAVPVIIALVATGSLLTLVLARATSGHQSIYWFTLLLIVNVAWLGITLAETLSATPAAAAFWQGLLPMAWISVPVLLLMFVTSYVDDTDRPLGFISWSVILASTSTLSYFAGLTGLVETHIPNQAKLEYWGYQSQPGSASSLVYLWAMILAVTSLVMLVRAYRRAVDERRRRQLKIFIWGLSQYIVTGVVFDLIINAINPEWVPPMAFLYTTVLGLIVGYGILRQGVFQISAAALSEPILEHLAEAVLGVNTQLGIEFVNSGATTIFSYTKQELHGMPLRKLFPPSEFTRFNHELGLGAQSFSIEDIMGMPRRGDKVPLALTVSRIHSDRGELAGYIVVAQNLTEIKKRSIELAQEKASVERKVAQRTRELHEEQARLRSSIEGLGLGFILVDDAGKIIVQNHALAAILGLSRPLSSLEEGSRRLVDFDLAASAKLAQSEHSQIESREVGAGSQILRVFIGPVTSREGKKKTPLGSVILIEDITEAKVLERSRDEFFSIASHELRTPLTAIKGNSSMLLSYHQQELKNPDTREMVHDIHESSERLISIVNDFLDLSRLEQGKMLFEPRAFSIEKIIENVAYEMKSVLREKHLYFKLNKTLGELPDVWADPNRVKQIVYNLVGNAAINTASGGISVSAGLEAGFLRVSVIDTGRGISVEQQKYLFHKFQQASDSILTRDSTRGTGLGLYISKLMVENMGGSIRLERSELNKGTEFSFTLPLAQNNVKAS